MDWMMIVWPDLKGNRNDLRDETLNLLGQQAFNI